MPRLRTTCAQPRCRVIVERDYCRVHGEVRARAREARDKRRGNSASRGYGAKWRVRRMAFLQINEWCVDPYGRHRGQQVRSKTPDHIVSLRAGGKDDESNWRAVCWSCHSTKTVREDGGFGRRRAKRDAA